MPRAKSIWVSVGLAVLVAAAVMGMASTRVRRDASTKMYCGPDGQLTRTAPIQSHRGYCVRTFTSTGGVRPGVPFDFRFDIVDDRGTTVRQFSTVHEKIMHVIVVRHDLTQFQHLHPIFFASDGRFTVRSLVLPSAGPYRLFADFSPVGVMIGPDGPLPVTVPVDLAVGDERSYHPLALPPPSDTATAGGYQVILALPESLRVAEAARLTFTIRRNGESVTDLQSYLGANGHAVLLREGDLAFTHIHALDDHAALQAGQLPFMVDFVEPGRYRIFVQFQHQGTVQTVAFTLPLVTAGTPGDVGAAHTGH